MEEREREKNRKGQKTPPRVQKYDYLPSITDLPQRLPYRRGGTPGNPPLRSSFKDSRGRLRHDRPRRSIVAGEHAKPPTGNGKFMTSPVALLRGSICVVLLLLSKFSDCCIFFFVSFFTSYALPLFGALSLSPLHRDRKRKSRSLALGQKKRNKERRDVAVHAAHENYWVNLHSDVLDRLLLVESFNGTRTF